MENEDARRYFEEHLVRCYRHIYRYIVALVPDRVNAEDVFQETCLTLLRRWQDYDQSRPIMPWVCGIALNHVRAFYKRSRRHEAFLSEAAIASVSEAQHRLSARTDWRLEDLRDCLHKLTAAQRALLRKCYQRRGAIKALAEANQLDPNVLYKQLEKLRRTLFECIEDAAATE
jgi:RNA polymerase sigma-70 factor (ECF subfamily)